MVTRGLSRIQLAVHGSLVRDLGCLQAGGGQKGAMMFFTPHGSAEKGFCMHGEEQTRQQQFAGLP